MFCAKCGIENRRAAKFCDHCGAPMGAAGSSGASWLRHNLYDIIIRVAAIGLILGLFVYSGSFSPPTANPGGSESNASPGASPEGTATHAAEILQLTCGVQPIGGSTYENYVVTGTGVNTGTESFEPFFTMTVLSPDGTILESGNDSLQAVV